jgi:replication-associated recombination protein RarA
MNQLISDYLRPKSFQEMMLPNQLKIRLQKMIDEQNVMNMIFHGKPGSGKTSAAQIICDDENFEVIKINGSLLTGIDIVRNKIPNFANSMSILNQKKIVFIDEADYVSKNAQASMRGLIEDTSRNCRYIFTANEVSKIHAALCSRLIPICFDLTSAQTQSALEEYVRVTIEKLKQRSESIDAQRVETIIRHYYPDHRNIANHLEFEFS